MNDASSSARRKISGCQQENLREESPQVAQIAVVRQAEGVGEWEGPKLGALREVL